MGPNALVTLMRLRNVALVLKGIFTNLYTPVASVGV